MVNKNRGALDMSKHPKTKVPSDKDLRQDPGMGRTRGTNNSDGSVEVLEGESTFEGDVKNDTTPVGGINQDRRGHTNK
jgi:hypothetical protein